MKDSRTGPDTAMADLAAEFMPAAEADLGAPGPTLSGAALIRRELQGLPNSPGVYRMLDARGEVLYVGKAKSLRKRVASYARARGHTVRIAQMIATTCALEVVLTGSEAEALLLEANLIKRFRPRYNIVLRDDKSFPYILLSGDHPYPRIDKHRGARTQPGEYFGPFASAGAVTRTLTALQRAFLLRSCSDPVFAGRSRPCLLHQIKRCSAPCVGRISPEDYGRLVDQARDFLAGRSRDVQADLSRRMEAASESLEFETAALLRDRIRALTQVQAHQGVRAASLEEADILAAHQEGGQTCIQVFFFRGGQNWGNRAYFPRHDASAPVEEVLAAFVGQFYADKLPPPELVLSHELPEDRLIADALAVRAGRRVRLSLPQRGEKRELLTQALDNARAALGRRLAESASQRRLLAALAEVFALDAAPERIEVYDNSHIQGAHAVGAMIVAGAEGFLRNQYRKFSIREAPRPGDDYAMLREVLTRRFGRLMRDDPGRESAHWPDLVLIDGGPGQLSVACQVFADLGVEDVALAAISKGPERNAGREQFHLPGRPAMLLPPNSPVLYFLQRLRDEAHRFAIGSHRAKRAKAAVRSALDEIPGVGPRRKRALLHHFGSAKAVGEAGLADIEAVEGISHALARRIYDHFHATPGG